MPNLEQPLNKPNQQPHPSSPFPIKAPPGPLSLSPPPLLPNQSTSLYPQAQTDLTLPSLIYKATKHHNPSLDTHSTPLSSLYPSLIPETQASICAT
jgi:hypothetical protein